MNEKTNKYALAALKKKRATIASEIVQLERKLEHRQDSLTHIDATLQILDPSVDPDAIPNARITKRVKLFRHGELNRLILGAFRNSDGALHTTKEVVTAVIESGGFGENSRAAMTSRVRGNLTYLRKQGKLEKIGERLNARWRVSDLA